MLLLGHFSTPLMYPIPQNIPVSQNKMPFGDSLLAGYNARLYSLPENDAGAITIYRTITFYLPDLSDKSLVYLDPGVWPEGG